MQEPLRKCSATVPCFKPKLGAALVNKENQKNGHNKKTQKENIEILFNHKVEPRRKTFVKVSRSMLIFYKEVF